MIRQARSERSGMESLPPKPQNEQRPKIKMEGTPTTNVQLQPELALCAKSQPQIFIGTNSVVYNIQPSEAAGSCKLTLNSKVQSQVTQFILTTE